MDSAGTRSGRNKIREIEKKLKKFGNDTKNTFLLKGSTTSCFASSGATGG